MQVQTSSRQGALLNSTKNSRTDKPETHDVRTRTCAAQAKAMARCLLLSLIVWHIGPNIGGLKLQGQSYLVRHARADGRRTLNTVARPGKWHHCIQKRSPQRLTGHPTWPLPAALWMLRDASTFEQKSAVSKFYTESFWDPADVTVATAPQVSTDRNRGNQPTGPTQAVRLMHCLTGSLAVCRLTDDKWETTLKLCDNFSQRRKSCGLKAAHTMARC